MEFDQLIKHMSPSCRDLFEKAVATASSRSHYAVDIEHWLLEAITLPEPELITVLQHFGVAPARVETGLQTALEHLRTGNGGFPKIGPDVARLLFEAWMLASSQFQSLEIRPVHLLLALTESSVLRLRALKISSEFEKLRGEELRAQCRALLDGPGMNAAPAGSAARAPTKTPALDQFTIDLTALARAGEMDPVLGRDLEIRQMIDILCRRRQNNPILTGEAGVGKTAVVEGLAQRIAAGDVPEGLRGVALRSLDLGLLQAGAGVKGEFENRLKNVIKEIQQSAQPVILFIDEAHTLIGAGNQAGAGDAANLLKPALARGELRTIAATTWAEYKKYFESDAALTRRFQLLKVDEPSEEQAVIMLRGLAPSLEKHHQVVLLDEAVVAAVKLSHRYIAGRQLPDKCVSLLDTACARVNLSLNTTPPALERCQRALDAIAAELARLEREQRIGHDHASAVVELEVKRLALEAERGALAERWRQAKELAVTISGLRRRLEALADAAPGEAGSRTDPDTELRQELARAREQLAAVQGDAPLLYDCVDAQVVAQVVSDWTGIPVGRMQADEIRGVLALREALAERVIGQPHALELIAKTMLTARAKLGDPGRPLGVFMLVGPSGVGKTETALALAQQLYGSERSITVINMSEFKEEHKVSLLMGSPPGYVGYGEGGLLTEAVRRKPYSVVLLDEIEKAHPGVQDIFYQVFDKGMLRDGEGRDIDFKNTVIVMTSNTASEQIERLCVDPETRPTPAGLLAAIGPTLRETYKPAFLGRVNIIPYFPLDDDSLARIARMQLAAIQRRVEAQYRVPLGFSDRLVQHIIGQCRSTDTGARQINALLTNTLLPCLAERVLSALAQSEAFPGIHVDVTDDGVFSIELRGPEVAAATVAPPRRKQRAKTVGQ